MDQNFEYLFLRRVPIWYESPAACEFVFSGTSEPIIVLEPFPVRRGPTGLILGGEGNAQLSWATYPGAICYSLYKAVDDDDPYGNYVLVAECIPNYYDLTLPGTYRVTALTPDGESPLSDPIIFLAAVPTPDPCDLEPGEDVSAIPSKFGVEEIFFNIDFGVPSVHLNFANPYVPVIVNFATWPVGDNWSMDIQYVSGMMSAGGGAIYSGWGLVACTNGAISGITIHAPSQFNTNPVALATSLAAESWFLLESDLAPGDVAGVAINLRNTSWADGTLGSTDPVDPDYDPSLLLPNNFSSYNSATLTCNLKMRARFWRNTDPATNGWSRARVMNWDTIVHQPDLIIPDAIAGPLGPLTYRFRNAPDVLTEWDGVFNCYQFNEFSFYVQPNSCDGYPYNDLAVRGNQVFDCWSFWCPQYVDNLGVLHSTPAWITLIPVEDYAVGAQFTIWAGTKLHGQTPAGTYTVSTQYPMGLFMDARKWPVLEQTRLFWDNLDCLKVEAFT